MDRMILSIAAAIAVAIAPASGGAQPAPAAPRPAAPAAPAAQPPAPRPPGKLPPLEQATLANGLRIAVLRNDAAPIVSVQLWYRAGSKDEPRDRRGMAQMFKHLMFQGTKHLRADAHASFVNGVGGFTHALADEDATRYINTLPAGYLDFAIRLEAERMRNLLLRPEVIAQVREVAKDELRQRENEPLARGFLKFMEVAYTKHPYAWTADGHRKDLEAVTAADLEKFYGAYYQPNNAMLVVVGKATLDEVKASAEKHFGPIAKAPEPPRPSRAAAEPPPQRRREVGEPGRVGLTLIGFHIPAARDRDIYALQVASIVLGAGESSRLRARLKSTDPKSNPKRPYALDGGVEAVVREEPGVLITVGIYREAAQAEGVEAAILDELARLGAAGPTADELRKAKNQIQSGFVFSLENAQSLAEAIGRSWILVGDPAAFLRDLDEIEKLTPADVARAVKQHLAADKATIVVIPPKGGK